MTNYVKCSICGYDRNPEKDGVFEQPVYKDVSIVTCEKCNRLGDEEYDKRLMVAGMRAIILSLRELEKDMSRLEEGGNLLRPMR